MAHEFRVNLKGVTKFRPPNRVTNRILYGLMLVEDIKTIEMAKLLGVSQRAVERWIADGIIPKQPRQDQLAKILKCPPHILFSELQY
jgi:transcriptional regulator with XRE-family HTH domain